MLYRISQGIVRTWQREQIIPSESSEAYVYGVQLLLSTLLNIICIAVISGLAALPFAWIPFLAGFIPLRITAGGFHAKTPLRCFITFCGTYLIFISLVLHLHDSGIRLAILSNSIVTVLAVCLCSPIPASNKPLSDEEIPQKRMLSIVITSVLLLISLSSIKFNAVLSFTLYMTFGELIAAVFLLTSKIAMVISKKPQENGNVCEQKIYNSALYCPDQHF